MADQYFQEGANTMKRYTGLVIERVQIIAPDLAIISTSTRWPEEINAEVARLTAANRISPEQFHQFKTRAQQIITTQSEKEPTS